MWNKYKVNRYKKIVSFLIASMILLFSINTGYAININSASAILMEAETGNILYEKNSEVQRPMASTSKIMTYLLAMDAVKEGRISLNDRVRVSRNAANAGGSSYGLKENDVLTVEELLNSMMIISANDSAVVLGEHIEGNIGQFCQKMNEKAKSLGLNSAYFVNPNGMPLKNNDQNKISAKDLALLSKHVIDLHGDHLLKITSQKQFNGTYKKFTKNNTNRLLQTPEFVDGLKTGYTNSAGHCLVSTRKIGEENRLISVVLGGKTGNQRYDDSRNLISYGLNNFYTQRIMEKGEILGYKQIESQGSIPIEFVATSNLSLLGPKTINLSQEKEIIFDDFNFTEDILDKKEINTILRLKDGREIQVNLLARRGISVLIDKEPIIFDQINPMIIDSTSLIPLRKVSESLGARIEWDGENRRITGIKDDKEFILTLDSKKAILNGEYVDLIAPPIVVEGNTMVPARFIAESLEMDVEWDEDIRTVNIYTSK